MKQYPSIAKEINTNVPVYIFDKLDGSNIRAEWNDKKGFYKFGSRKKLIDSQTKFLGEAIELINKNFQYVDVWLKENKIKQAVAYFEFFGPNSFAGQHIEEPHECVLLDVEIHNKGFLSPELFLSAFEDKVPTPLCLGRGKYLTEQDKQAIVNGEYPNLVEGVVCKAKTDPKSFHNLMFKIKTQAWIDKVKSLYKDPNVLLDLL